MSVCYWVLRCLMFNWCYCCCCLPPPSNIGERFLWHKLKKTNTNTRYTHITNMHLTPPRNDWPIFPTSKTQHDTHTHTHANIDNIIAIMARTCHLYCETNRKRSPHFSRYHKCPVYGGNIGDGCFSGFHILAVSWLLYRLFLRSSLSQGWRWQSTVSWHRIWILWAKTKC